MAIYHVFRRFWGCEKARPFIVKRKGTRSFIFSAALEIYTQKRVGFRWLHAIVLQAGTEIPDAQVPINKIKLAIARWKASEKAINTTVVSERNKLIFMCLIV